MIKLINSLLRHAGQACCGCEVWCFDDAGICSRCQALLPRIGFGCKTCGVPLPGRWAQCATCITQDPVLRNVVVPLRYEGLGRDLVLALKYNHQLWAARSLAALMFTQDVESIRETVLLPIPSVTARRRRRGFSPAHEIAQCLTGYGGWCIASSALRRVGYQPPQSSLEKPASREQNVRGVFTASTAQSMPAHVCLVDDVMTTGATLRAAAVACMAAGAVSVSAWVATRAT